MDNLKQRLQAGDAGFWDALKSDRPEGLAYLPWQALSTLRKRALAKGLATPGWPEIRIAMVGGYTFAPFQDFLGLALAFHGVSVRFYTGGFESAAQEILDPRSNLYTFAPHFTLFLPSLESLPFTGSLFDPVEEQKALIQKNAGHLISLGQKLSSQSQAPVLLGNFFPEAQHDPGPIRSRLPGFSWSYRRLLNVELGLRSTASVSILDIDFLATRLGALRAFDEKSWLESRQPFSPEFLVALALEASQNIQALRLPMKKVLVLDLDGTLWGGVIGDDGVEGLELGNTSARGEAFKRFQRYILTLKNRGVLLAVCSKNDEGNARAPFVMHPETVLKLEDFSAFRANWKPKPDNLKSIAQELQLGLESLVFVDDNPAEIEAVRQFTPEVSCLLLGADPSQYVSQLQDGRYFEPVTLTSEDQNRTQHYQVLKETQQALSEGSDLTQYLRSLEMQATVSLLTEADLGRAAQLINKSNQFNLTTKRRSEAQLQALRANPQAQILTVRLNDRLVDHGLISVVIAVKEGDSLEIDTWLMSCRVLHREVEKLVLTELVAVARKWGLSSVVGSYLPTSKNALVKDLLPVLGFSSIPSPEEVSRFRLEIARFQEPQLPIRVIRRDHESNGSHDQVAGSLR